MSKCDDGIHVGNETTDSQNLSKPTVIAQSPPVVWFFTKVGLYTCSRFQGSICKRPYLLSTYRMNSISERTRFCYNAAWLCNKARSKCCHGFATNTIIPISIPLRAGPHISLKNEG